MHSRTAGCDYDAVEFVFTDIADDHFLARVGAHVSVISGESNTFPGFSEFPDGLHIDDLRYVGSATAYVNTCFASPHKYRV